MKNIIIVGAGGLGREVAWLIERINEESSNKWKILGFADDGVAEGTRIQDFPVLGNVAYLLKVEEKTDVVCAIAKPEIKKKIIEQLQSNDKLSFPNLIDPDAIWSDSVQIGMGNIICANVVLSVNVQIEDFILIDWNSTIGHETQIKSYATLYPGVNVSGNTVIGSGTEIGTAACIIQGKQVGSHVVVGAGTVVIRDIENDCTVVGNPARMISPQNTL